LGTFEISLKNGFRKDIVIPNFPILEKGNLMDNLKIIFDEIKPLMTVYQPPLVATSNYESRLELYTDKPVVIEGRKKPIIAFAGLIIQSGYVGFYFMPVYSLAETKDVFKPELLKLLKGKACFHIKKTSPELLEQILEVLRIGFEKYQEKGWI
jgi:hypothetical protein